MITNDYTAVIAAIREAAQAPNLSEEFCKQFGTEDYFAAEGTMTTVADYHNKLNASIAKISTKIEAQYPLCDDADCDAAWYNAASCCPDQDVFDAYGASLEGIQEEKQKLAEWA